LDILFNLLFGLMKKKIGNWESTQLREILSGIISIKNSSSKQCVQNSIDLLNIIDQYNLGSNNFKKCLNTLGGENTITDALKKLNMVAVESNFQMEVREKDAHDLLEEFKSLNESDTNLLDYVNNKTAFDHLTIVKNREKVWNLKDIKDWSVDARNDTNNFNIVEAIAVIKQAYLLDSGFTLTDTQILCSLISFNNKTAQRKLLQVATGEGKSVIVCILAILSALKGGRNNQGKMKLNSQLN